MLPEGLAYLNSWLGKDGGRCFQLMETDDTSLFYSRDRAVEGFGEPEVIETAEKPNEDNDA